MTFLLYLTGLFFIGAIASFVASPLLTREEHQPQERASDGEFARWEKQKTDAYAAIKEAEFDLQMGKLTQEDYQAIRDRYEARALEAFAQLDKFNGAPPHAAGETSES